MPASSPPFERFGASYRVNPVTGCWDWTGDIQSSGYGRIKCFGRMASAHRLAHELYKGPIPVGRLVLHSCDNKLCVNPDHLRHGTQAENIAEALERGRIKKGAEHALYGMVSPLRGAGSASAVPVMVLGKPYGSLNEAERALGLGSGSVAYWLRTGNPKAQKISKEEYKNAQ